MKHQVAGRKFGRVRRQRKALIKSLVDNFVLREKITTTEAKAKELKSKIDRVINKVKKGKDKDKMAMMREMNKTVSAASVKKLSGDFLKRFEGRKSGYAKISKLGRRKSDGAKMAVIEFV